MKDLKNQNIERHGDPGPFLVCATTSSPKGDHKDGLVSSCFKCGVSVHIPEKKMTDWRDYGARVVCPRCSGGTIGQILEIL
jgi:hypothetical protein